MFNDDLKTNRGRVLLVEDDRDACFVLDRALADAGFEVFTFCEGTHIVNRVIPHPDIYLLDNGLPLIDGIALCKFLKVSEATRNIPVVIISADAKHRNKALAAGAADFIEKPFKMHELVDKLDALVKEHTQEI